MAEALMSDSEELTTSWGGARIVRVLMFLALLGGALA